MKEFLKKIHVIEKMSMNLDIEKNDFISILRKKVDPRQSNFFDLFSSSKNVYKGIVTNEAFEIKKKFQKKTNLAKVKGEFSQDGNLLRIDMEITAFYGSMKFGFWGMIATILSMIILNLMLEDFYNDSFNFYLLLFLGCLPFLGFYYYLLRKYVKDMKSNIEKDFTIIQENNNK